MTDTPAEVPQSSALAEATVDSLAELFSRDPEGLQKADRARIVKALREQRVRWVAANGAKPAAKPKSPVKTLQATVGLEDTDL